MPSLADSHGPKPKSWTEFESIVCSAAKNRWRNPDFTLHGRQGQKQDGVDIYGHDAQGALIGLQCKNSLNGVSGQTMLKEVENAERFKPALARLYIATTGDADREVQAAARTISEERKSLGLFTVQILFWNDIWQDLSLDESRLFQHYPQWKPAAAISVGPSHDQRLFEAFKGELAFEPSIRLLTEQDFAGSFSRSDLKPLHLFLNRWTQPEYEFLDESLQQGLEEFRLAAAAVSHRIAMKTYPVGTGDYNCVDDGKGRGGLDAVKRMEQTANDLNEEAGRVAALYVKFIRTGRGKLST